MKFYTFNINKTVRQLMPGFLVKPIHLAWLQTINVSLKNLYADFLAYMALQRANATINSSVNRLTQALWDNFDSTQSIYILQNTNYQDEPIIYLLADGASPTYDYLISDAHTPNDYDYLSSEFDTDFNFIVRIPVALAASSAAIYAFVAKYVFAGISFTIETF